MLSYGVLCLYAVIRHGSDAGWVHGFIVAHAWTAAATGKQFEIIREIQAAAPAFFFYSTRALTYLMSAWEFSFVLLVLWNRLTRALAVTWGVLFFLGSSALLQVQ